MGYFSGGYSLSETGPETDALLDEIAKVLFCQYGVTEYNDALTAYNAGKGLFAVYNKKTYILTDYINSTFYFGQTNKALNYASLSLSASGWSVISNVGIAPTNSPVFTGTPTAPTADANSNDEQIATTAYADRASYASLMEDTASGEIASFPDGAQGAPVVELTADIEPIQDLHGQASPYPPNGGKNKLNAPDKSNITNGFIFGTFETPLSIDLPAGTYTYSFKVTGTPSSGAQFNLLDFSSGSSVSIDGKAIATGANSLTFTTATPITALKSYTNTTAAVSVSELMIEAGSSATPYAPYSNICPISGYTGAEIPRTGKNLVTANATEYYNYAITATGEPSATSDTLICTGYIPVGTNTNCIIKANKVNTTFDFVGVACYDENKAFLGRIYGNNTQTLSVTFEAGTKYIRFFMQENSVSDPLTPVIFATFKVQLEFGSTATDYEDNGTVYSVSWTDEGTVYKGRLEYKGNGEWEITKTHKGVDMGSLNWAMTATSTTGVYRAAADISDAKKAPANNVAADIISSAYKTVTASNTYNSITGISVESTIASVRVYDPNYNGSGSATSFKTSVTGQTLVYELATPETFTVSGPDPETLLGDNNMWSNTGDISVKYRCNTALYIEKKLGA